MGPTGVPSEKRSWANFGEAKAAKLDSTCPAKAGNQHEM